ncbi:MAG: FAD-binding oxidoreductase [Acidobacteriota bacterium]
MSLPARQIATERMPLWWEQVDWGEAAPRLEGPIEADVAVIGAGYTGLSAAYHLAGEGVKVVILESERVGYGASGRTGGIVGAVHPGRLRRELRQLGMERFRRLVDFGVETVQIVDDLVRDNQIDCDFQRSGELCLAHSKRHLPLLEESARVLTDLGYPARYLDRRALREVLNTSAYAGAFLAPQSAHLDPGRYVFGLGQAARRLGVSIYERSPVVSLSAHRTAGSNGRNRGARASGALEGRLPSTRVIVRTEHGEVCAREVIVATNGYTGSLHPFLVGRYFPLRSYIVATEPLSDEEWASIGWKNGCACYDTKIMLYYFRPTRDRRIVFGGRADYAERENSAMYEQLERAIITVFPSLRGRVRISHRWYGLLAYTFDRTPRIGRLPGLPQVWYSIGYSGHGVGVASLCGKILAWNLLGRHDYDDVPFNHSRLRRFPLYPLRRLTAPAYLAYCRLQDAL